MGAGDFECTICGRRPSFVLDGRPRCGRCTVASPALLRRSLYTSLVVGTVLVAINQGEAIASANLAPALLWKVPLTYAVPFCVTAWGALINSRIA